MGTMRKTAKVAFWVGVFFALTSFYTIAQGEATIIVAALFVIPLMLPHLYLMFAEGRAEARGPAEPAE